MDELDKFVEGRFMGIVCEESTDSVQLMLEDSSRCRYVLTAHQVDELLMLEMRNNNIIDRISVWNSESDSLEYQKKLGVLLYGDSDTVGKYPAYAARINEMSEKIKARQRVLLEVEPVFGALILMLIQRFEIAPHKPILATT